MEGGAAAGNDHSSRTFHIQANTQKRTVLKNIRKSISSLIAVLIICETCFLTEKNQPNRF